VSHVAVVKHEGDTQGPQHRHDPHVIVFLAVRKLLKLVSLRVN